MKYSFYLVCLLVVSFSCKKSATVTEKRIFLSKKIYSENGFSYAYNYGQNNRLESIDQSNSSGNIYAQIAVKNRNAAGEITEFHTVPSDAGSSTVKHVVYYDASGRRDSIKRYSWPANVLGSIRIYEYPAGKILEKDYFPDYRLKLSVEARLTPDGKNIKELIYYNVFTGLSESRTIYTAWDAGKNPETLVPLAFSITFTGLNNVLAYYSLSPFGDTSFRDQTYTYNSDGYATKSILTGTNIATPHFITYEYIKK